MPSHFSLRDAASEGGLQVQAEAGQLGRGRQVDEFGLMRGRDGGVQHPAGRGWGHGGLEARPGQVMIEGDAGLLAQMLVNLVENGLRHTPRGTAVRVAVQAAGTEAVLKVSDDGPGVPAADRALLFDRFYRLERSRSTPGSGLGLSLAAAVARLHGAEIVLSDANPGLEARVSFAPAP